MAKTLAILLLLLVISGTAQPTRGFAAPGDGRPTATASARYFDQKEFPNFFLPEQYRNLPPVKVPSGVVARIHAQVDQALGSIFNRLTIPITTVKEGVPTTHTVNFISYLETALKRIDPGVRVMPSSGVVRSALGYIYNEMHRAYPSKSPEAVLQSIIHATGDLPGYEIRGIGSDFDILIAGHQPGKFKELQDLALKITNSSEESFGLRGEASGFKKAIFAVGDIKDYQEQMTRSTRQGGSTLDFLAFDPTTHRTIEPEAVSGIVDDFIRGQFSYIAAASPRAIEDPVKQTVRGMRPFLELPFLQIKDQAVFRQELEAMLSTLKGGQNLPQRLEKAREQFDKMVRNARFEGAHNRLYRAQPGSLDELVLQVSREFQRVTGKATIPEFADRFPLAARGPGKSELNGLPKRLLTNVEDFARTYTRDGVLYHGTPSIDNGMAIMRGGLFVSKGEAKAQTTKSFTMAAYGRGIYTSPEQATSLAYAGSSGVVFEVKPKIDSRVNVLVWNERTQKDPFIKTLLARTNGNIDEAFAILAREHGIDIIVNNHVLVQNVDAVDLPKDIKSLVKAYGTVVKNPAGDPLVRASAFNDYESLRGYAVAIGEKDVPPLGITRDQLSWEFLHMLAKEAPAERVTALKAIGILMPTDPNIQTRVSDLLADSHPPVKEEAMRILWGSKVKDPAIQIRVVDLLAEADKGINSLAKGFFARNRDVDPQVLRKLGTVLEHPSVEARRSALFVLGYMQCPLPDVQLKLAALVSSSERILSQAAASVLGKQTQLTPQVKVALIRLLDNSDPQVKYSTLEALGELKVKLPALRTKVVALMHDESPLVRAGAIDALQSLDGENVDSQLKIVDALIDTDSHPQMAADNALSLRIKPTDPRVQARLVELLDHPDPKVRSRAVNVLGASKHVTPEVQLKLVELLREPGRGISGVRGAASRALHTNAPTNPAVLARLEELAAETKDRDIVQLAESTKKRIVALQGELSSADAHVRLKAAGQLLEGGDIHNIRAAEVVRTDGLAYRDPAVRAHAQKVLEVDAGPNHFAQVRCLLNALIGGLKAK